MFEVKVTLRIPNEIELSAMFVIKTWIFLVDAHLLDSTYRRGKYFTFVDFIYINKKSEQETNRVINGLLSLLNSHSIGHEKIEKKRIVKHV